MFSRFDQYALVLLVHVCFQNNTNLVSTSEMGVCTTPSMLLLL